MPIAISMDHHGGDPTSPLSPRMTKAAFFRARSPPVLDRTSATGTARAHSPNELAARLGQVNIELHSPTPLHPPSESPHGHAGPSSGRSPELLGPGGSATFMPTPYGHDRGYASSVGTQGHTPPMQHASGVPTPSPALPGAGGRGVYSPGGPALMAEGSDEMLMTLLAGQAAVDCEAFGVSSWEDVESWKKVRLHSGKLTYRN